MKLISLLAIVSAVVLTAGTSIADYKPVSLVDQFDNAPALAAVGKTAGGFLAYNSYLYLPLVNPQPPSGHQVASSGIRTQTLEGQAAILPINSSVKCFDLRSVRNYCGVTPQSGLVSVPISCSAQFSGRSALTGQVKTRVLIYNPGLNLRSDFNTTTFAAQDFSCLDRVDVVILSAVLPAPEQTLSNSIDDVRYVAYVKE